MQSCLEGPGAEQGLELPVALLVATGISTALKRWGTVRWGALGSVREECFPPLCKVGRKAKGRIGLE